MKQRTRGEQEFAGGDGLDSGVSGADAKHRRYGAYQLDADPRAEAAAKRRRPYDDDMLEGTGFSLLRKPCEWNGRCTLNG